MPKIYVPLFSWQKVKNNKFDKHYWNSKGKNIPKAPSKKWGMLDDEIWHFLFSNQKTTFYVKI